MARGKAEADRALLAFAKDKGLDLVILRPGLVVGEGTAALHGGLGFFNNEQHVIGWNGGANPLPFVLADDVADAIIQALSARFIAGRAYNLVGDVRPTAREFVKLLATATGRPIAYHPQSVDWLQTAELFKWLIKRATGKTVDKPARRDLISRGLNARFDCDDAKHDLDWHPVADRDAFIARAVEIHRTPFPARAVTGAASGERPLTLLHVFSTFAVGGPQTRFATIADRLGTKYRHLIVSMSGRTEAASLAWRECAL